MRLFVAIPLPNPVKDKLSDLYQPIDGLRWQDPGQFHLTLRFIGEVSQSKYRELDSRFDALTESRFSLKIKGLGCFPSKSNPRVLWAGITENEVLMRLQHKIEMQCRDVGLEPEQRDYIPHITLAKIKGTPKREVMSFIKQNKRFKLSPFLVRKFVLYKSELHRNGAVHKPQSSYELVSG